MLALLASRVSRCHSIDVPDSATITGRGCTVPLPKCRFRISLWNTTPSESSTVRFALYHLVTLVTAGRSDCPTAYKSLSFVTPLLPVAPSRTNSSLFDLTKSQTRRRTLFSPSTERVFCRSGCRPLDALDSLPTVFPAAYKSTIFPWNRVTAACVPHIPDLWILPFHHVSRRLCIPDITDQH